MLNKSGKHCKFLKKYYRIFLWGTREKTELNLFTTKKHTQKSDITEKDVNLKSPRMFFYNSTPNLKGKLDTLPSI
jgi:hypothetical protein